MTAATNLIKRSTIIQAAFWLGLTATSFMILLSLMDPMFALLRAVVLTMMAAILHYSNAYLFNRNIGQGNVDKYIFQTIVLLITLAVLRSLLEAYVYPRQIEPVYFQVRPFRPLFVILSTLFAYSVSTIVLYYIYLSQKEKILLQTISTHNEARLQYLQSQINPHFLFNALNNIYSLVITKSEKAPETLLMLTELLRYAVYQKPLEKVPLYDEVRKIELLISLFNLKNDAPYNITFEKENVHGIIEPMILLPLVENCLKHCDFDLNENAFVKINLSVNGDTLQFSTKNTFATTVKTAGGGVGLKNIRERLKLTYPDSHYLSAIADANIFIVDLTIKWKQK